MSKTSMRPIDPAEIVYAVTATLPNPVIAERYLQWLLEGHVQEVIKGGARSVEVVRLDSEPPSAAGGPVQVVSRYVFPTRQSYDRYVAEHAPRLRAEGLTRFGPAAGADAARFGRSLGTMVGRFTAD